MHTTVFLERTTAEYAKNHPFSNGVCPQKFLTLVQVKLHSFHIFTFKTNKTTTEILRQWFFAWQRPTLPGPFGPSTIGARGLNGRVRDGYVWNPPPSPPNDAAIYTQRLFSEN